MNQQFIGQFLTAALVTAILAAALFGQKNAGGRGAAGETEKFRRTLVEMTRGAGDSRKSARANVSAQTAADKFIAARASFAAPVNRANFSLGADFVIAMLDAARMETDGDGRKSAIVDLVYLIDLLENQPEAAALQKTLRAVIKESSTAAQIRLEIENAYKSYGARQGAEPKWYLDAGVAVTNLLCSTYVGDDAAMKNNLSDLKKLIKIAPQGTPGEISNPMNNLVRYAANASFSESDYKAIFDQAMNLFKTITASNAA